MMSKKLLAFAFMLMLGLTAIYFFSPLYYFSPEQKAARMVDQLVARNIEARGGAEAWQAVSSLRLTGQMDLGEGMHVPYVLEQKRPGKMCLEFVFDGETAVQCADGKTGWKVLPFRGRRTPEPMTAQDLRDTADLADLYGLLFEHADRGISLELVGREPVAGRDAFKLKVTLPQGAVRWVYLDAETALDIKLESTRMLRGKERIVETFYYDWQEGDGLLIPHRQETSTEGDNETHFLTVETVHVNPPIEDSRFAMPRVPAPAGGTGQ